MRQRDWMERMRLLGEIAEMQAHGRSLDAACCVINVSKSSVIRWRERVKQVLGNGVANALRGRTR